jgi:hypothetical protein
MVVFNLMASGSGQGLRSFRDPDAVEDDADAAGPAYDGYCAGGLHACRSVLFSDPVE